MGIIAWIIFGALAGWIASMLIGNNDEQGTLGNVVVGILGAIIGGFIARQIGIDGISGFNLISLFIAIVGAVGLLALVRGFNRV